MRTSQRVPSARSVAVRLNLSPPTVADVVCPRRRHDMLPWFGSCMLLSIVNQYEISHLALAIRSIIDDAITYRSDGSEWIEYKAEYVVERGRDRWAVPPLAAVGAW